MLISKDKVHTLGGIINMYTILSRFQAPPAHLHSEKQTTVKTQNSFKTIKKLL